MTPKHLGAIILLLLVTALPFCTTQNTYYVKPTPDTPCHEDPCHTLSEYVSESGQYFTSNTTIIFLPGEHVLQQNVAVTNVGRLAFIGYCPADVSRIICSDTTLTFTNICLLEIAGLAFHSCTIVLNTSSAVFKNTSFKYGEALFVHSSTITFDGATRFERSKAVFGGGLFAEESNLTFHGNTTFINNEAIQQGGGIYMIQSIVKFTGDASFIANIVHQGGGGGIYGYNSSLDFDFENTIIFLDNSAVTGGGILVTYSTVSFSGVSQFISNSAEHGGGVYVEHSNVIFGDNSRFVDNSAEYDGGGVYVEYSTVCFGDDNGFIGNSVVGYYAYGWGGGIYVWYSSLRFGDNSGFVDNSAVWGGGVYVDGSKVSFGDNSKFMDNSAELDGGGGFVGNSTVSFGDNSGFVENSAEYGGGVSVERLSTVCFGDNGAFIDNSAEVDGGGVYVKDSTVSFGDNSRFLNNSAEYNGGGVYVEGSTVRFGGTDFTENSADYFGGCMAGKDSTITNVGGSSHFMNNSARYGGCIFVDTCNLTFGKASILSGNSAITSSSYYGESADAWYGGAIFTSNSDLTFGGSQVLTNNSAGYGGAIYFTLDSKIYLLPNTTMYLERNFAQYRGGALFVEDNPFTYCIIDSDVRTSVIDAYCFIQTHVYGTGCTLTNENNYFWPRPGHSIELQFQENAANEAGSILYGGNLVSCGVCTTPYIHVTGEVALNTLSNVPNNLISSDPYRVCICVDNHPDCNQRITTYEIFPGVTIVVPVVAFGQYDGPVPAVIQTYISDGITLGTLQSTQQSDNTCTDLQYTVRSARDINFWSKATLTMYADEPCSTLGLPFEVNVNFLPCPLGFSLSPEGSCECDQRLHQYEVDCDINDQSILRKDNVWIGFVERSDNQSQELILHPHCPFDYCKRETDSVTFTTNTTDRQCNFNRSGHLCGACQHGFSLAVGSSRCLPCSNKFLALLTAFVFAGLSLVVFLFICKVTVAAGTFSGLIFYANIVRVNQTILFPSGGTNILTVFIAWLNLDLGFETCFFEGMDAYSFMWLQFVFPIYIWLLVGLITILCNVSTTAARIVGGTNPIAVLATLFFLSFTKLLRTIIAALSFTTLEYPDGETKVVWLYDGNIGYLDKNDGRHIALFLASLLVFLFLFLPYTLFLLLGHCILPRLDLNKLKWLSWPNYIRMKIFLDAYHAPYKDKHRYWIGLLLMVRFIVLLISAVIDIASPQDPHANLLVIIISTTMLGLWVWNASGGVYSKWYLNVVESSFLLNLVILAAATQYTKSAGGNQAAVYYTLVTFSFSTFIGIVIYHIYQRLKNSRAWRNCVGKYNDRRASGHGWQRKDAADELMEVMLPQVEATVTYVDIPTEERRQMRPITLPLTPTNSTDVHEPLNNSQREDAAANEEVKEMLPQVAPTVTTARAMCLLTHPLPPKNFTELREPLDILTQ